MRMRKAIGNTIIKTRPDQNKTKSGGINFPPVTLTSISICTMYSVGQTTSLSLQDRKSKCF